MTTIHEHLLHRSIGEQPWRLAKVKNIYGHRAWVDDLDIINELGGHTGCVNALSWSRSGQFLASGSDDTYLNIWSYNPDSAAKPFTLSTSVSTGHVANIFGVKFAPHSNDRTLITCAGDSQVRVFDIEYGGNYNSASREAGLLDSTRSRRFQNFFSNARFLNDGNTNSRVYKSHSARVKRLVTESSPYNFLTCSEDGEVRQWDSRQPSSAYPAPRGFRHLSESVPPPLISYRNFALDLNTISLSASQPYYIALGGAHTHCFLHDRRMLGRDLAAERGQASRASPDVGSHDDDMMDQATRCVKRFAPNNKFAMNTHDNGHITACKISDANPNELIASWSGDHIYSFDIVQSPDIREADLENDRTLRQNHNTARDGRDRKRKRTNRSSSNNLSRPGERRMRGPRESHTGDEGLSLGFRYGNRQNRTTPSDAADAEMTVVTTAPSSLFTEAQQLSRRIARSLVQLRKSVFDFASGVAEPAAGEGSSELTPRTTAYTTVLGQAASMLPQIDEVIRDWSYPIDPSPDDVMLQNTLRRNRQATRRFVQASGCLAAAMGGRLQTLSPVPDPRMKLFERIEPAQREGNGIDENQQFCYDFLKAILLWLSAGRDGVIQPFCKQADKFRDSQRFPLAPDDGPEEIDGKLIPYLLDLARDDKPVLNVDANRFEIEESRRIFASQVAAVNAFSRACKDPNPTVRNEPSDHQPASDLGAARRFWGVKVGRSLLMEAGEGINFDFVNRAFGGLRVAVTDDLPADGHEEAQAGDESPEAAETSGVSGAALQDVSEEASGLTNTAQSANDNHAMSDVMTSLAGQDTVMLESAGIIEDEEEAGNGEREVDDDDDDYDDNDDDDDDDHEFAAESIAVGDDDSEDENLSRQAFHRAIGFGRARERAMVEFDKFYSSHTRVYKGHCNVQTVKDVNFYGLNDEYIVSGSDSGHFFIWDRKTTQLVNILEGDGEVVNVVTGHPYEPMVAASGIDSTIKIFSPDRRLQENARQGIDLANPVDKATPHSSLRSGGLRRRAARPEGPPTDEPSEGLTSKKAMHKSYEIMSQNDVHRQEGITDAYITRGMLTRLAAHLQTQANGQGAVVIDDECTIM